MAEAIRFGDLPARLLAVLNDPVVERIIITNNRLYTESSEGSNPEFGERIEKFQNGVKVKTIIKKIESLNG
jgi:hypothetical protein